MTDCEIAWLAGLFEGEGCITNAAKNAIQLMVQMTDQDVVERCREVAEVGWVRGPYVDQHRPNQQPIWVWGVHKADDVAQLLETIRPLMGKRRQARIDEAIERLSHIRGRAERGCSKGHHNWRPTANGGRYCLDCSNDRQRERRESPLRAVPVEGGLVFVRRDGRVKASA